MSELTEKNHEHITDAVEGHTHEHHHEHHHEHSHEHSHDDCHPHTHVHDPNEKKRQLARLSRIIGHLESVKRMIQNDADCSDVLMQLAACRSALNGLGKEIIKEHLAHCITHAIEQGDVKAVEDFQDAIQKYI